MVWLTSLPAAVLVAGGLALALLAALGGRLAVRALVPAAERDAAYTIAAPLMPALGALFALFIGLTLASEAGFPASAQGIVSSEAADASRLAWAATSPGVNPPPIQSALLGYLKTTRAHEWSGSTAADGDDPATVHAIASLETAVRTQLARTALGTPGRASSGLDLRDRLVITASSVIIMPALGLIKHRLGRRLGSGATAGEGTQNLICAALAATVLAGLAIVAAWPGGWAADPLIALVIAGWSGWEGWRAWHGRVLRTIISPRGIFTG